MARAKYYSGDDASREPEEITELLGSLIERLGTEAARTSGTIVAEWPSLAPRRWAEEARPVGVRRGTLLVEVSSGASATLLRHDTGALLARLSQRFGPGVVEAVRVRVSGGLRRGENP